MTDDLDMGAILNEVTFEETILAAVEAGNDLVMICHRVELVEEARKHLEKLSDPMVYDALERIRKAKSAMGAPFDFTMEGFKAVDDEIWDLRVDTLGEEQAKILSVEDGKRSPVETY